VSSAAKLEGRLVFMLNVGALSRFKNAVEDKSNS